MDKVPRKPKRWTEDEDNVLYEEAIKQASSGPIKDWHRIAAKLPGRTNKDCRKRWVNRVRGGLRSGSWSEAEDQMLRDAVAQFGQKWTKIAQVFGFRSPDQCAKRWQYTLDPKLDHREWTTPEDHLLLDLVQKVGRDWKSICHQHFPTRSRNDVKNRYTILSRRLLSGAASQPDADTASSGFTETMGDGVLSDTASIGHPQTPGFSIEEFFSLDAADSAQSNEYDFPTIEGQHESSHGFDLMSLDGLGFDSYDTYTTGTPLPDAGSKPQNDESLSMAYFMTGMTENHNVYMPNMDVATSSGTDPNANSPASPHGEETGSNDETFTLHTCINPQDSLALNFQNDVGPDGEQNLQLTFNSDYDFEKALACLKDSEVTSKVEAETASVTSQSGISKVVLVVEKCDHEIVKYLIDITRPIQGRVKMEMIM
ncbi:hypothetical protein SODALDRAFT_329430 [Sodiomyces alkalinus F11]|uniref:Myb-like DNA-binding domain-containing protein n=1 Tax=Sodiomyces alkalinus (strain CBS 110278 / VKM F-3762 / F11) TaxID=1314773 RepID=A0A3N2PL53_SODAK|nr:hypothetical protein SODALDRAFT_329430 [Sodiomyces alkalinus F11]ROT35242.1 hypothetical protein SODALDRAFT_329430 [Sodiomyces alkalinus F11]